MKYAKTLIFCLIITSIALTACSKPNANTPEKDPLAAEKVQTHNKIGKEIHALGKSTFDVIGQFALHHTETEEPKPTKEDLQKQFDSAFENSEKLRKTVTEEFQAEPEFIKKFESEYLPPLDAFLNAAKEQIEKAEDQESFTKLQELQKTFVNAHNKFIEHMNENNFY